MTVQEKAPSAGDRALIWLSNEIVSIPWDQEAFLSESEIARASGVSRTPVREAVLQLEAGGLLRRVPFKGAYVPALTTADIDEIMEVRTVIGRWATAKVAETSPETGERLLEIIAQQKEAANDPVTFIELDVEFHSAIVQAAHNKTLERVYREQKHKQQRLGIQALMADLKRATAVLDEHTEMAEAIRAGDPERAREAAGAHVVSTRRLLSER